MRGPPRLTSLIMFADVLLPVYSPNPPPVKMFRLQFALERPRGGLGLCLQITSEESAAYPGSVVIRPVSRFIFCAMRRFLLVGHLIRLRINILATRK